MRILGLDPGSRRTGWGVIDRHGSHLELVACGLIAPSAGPLPGRLAHLGRGLRQLIRRYRPSAAALEALFHGVNPRSLIVLAQARGALLTTLALDEVTIVEYTPAQVKSAVTGNGRADKQQVARMVEMALGLDGRGMAADTSDALAVAICYAQRLRVDRLEASGEPRRKRVSTP